MMDILSDSGRKGFFSRVIIMTAGCILAAVLLPGVTISSLWAAILTAVVIALLDNFVRPILVVVTLPVTMVSLGLFIFIINAVIIMLASGIVKGFEVHTFWDGLFFSLLLTVFSNLLDLPGRYLDRTTYEETDRSHDPDTDDDGFTPYEEVE